MALASRAGPIPIRDGHRRILLRASTLVLAFLVGCSTRNEEVIVYTSVDSIYAEEIFAAFTRETGIVVRPVYDTEEAKTLGLVHRLMAERGRPQADVFWNGECSRTAMLKREGLLDSYVSPSAAGIPASMRDADGAWTGFGARARVIVYNTERVKSPPRTLDELTRAEWKGRVAIANPIFGTTAAHAVALAQSRGPEAALRYFAALKDNGIRVVGGNSHVRDLVAGGRCDVGLTDTDDVWIGKARGDKIEMVYPDQDGAGTLVVPNSAALIKGAPHVAQARRFLDFLLRPATEAALARGKSRQMPVRSDVETPADVPRVASLRSLSIDWSSVTTSEDFFAKLRRVMGL